MHRIQRQLHTDHHHLQLLLNCIDKEIDCYDFDSKRPADIAIILSALEYIIEYSDKWHHPAEDIIYNKLLKKDIKKKKLIEQLQSEHQEIAAATDKIFQLFKMVAEDCIVPADELIGSARHFISLQHAHIKKENEFIYPLLEKSFTPEDWNAIETEVKIQSDPLFNKPSKAEYEKLYQYIIDLEDEK